MANLKTTVTDRWESTLSSALAAGATTINVTDTTGAPAIPFRVVVDPGNDGKYEEILVDGAKTATTFTLSAATSRGQGISSDIAHDSGAVIAIVPVANHINDLHDRVDAKATDANVVHLAGAETITGAKTFSVDPTLADGSSALSLTEGNAAYEALISRTGASAGEVPILQADNTLAFGDAGGGATVVRKSADESVSSSITLQDDDALLFAVAANEVWVFEASILYTAASATPDLKFTWAAPSGASGWYLAGGSTNPTIGLGVESNTAADTTVRVFKYVGYVANGATAGSVKFQWAQNTSSADATTVKAQSYIVAHKVA
jgi:hypothetical protein